MPTQLVRTCFSVLEQLGYNLNISIQPTVILLADFIAASFSATFATVKIANYAI